MKKKSTRSSIGSACWVRCMEVTNSRSRSVIAELLGGLAVRCVVRRLAALDVPGGGRGPVVVHVAGVLPQLEQHLGPRVPVAEQEDVGGRDDDEVGHAHELGWSRGLGASEARDRRRCLARSRRRRGRVTARRRAPGRASSPGVRSPGGCSVTSSAVGWTPVAATGWVTFARRRRSCSSSLSRASLAFVRPVRSCSACLPLVLLVGGRRRLVDALRRSCRRAGRRPCLRLALELVEESHVAPSRGWVLRCSTHSLQH